MNPATEKTSVLCDPAVVQEADFLALSRDIGYDVVTARIDLPITGMSCADCALTIGRALRWLDGVVGANVNLVNERAGVEYLPGAIQAEQAKQLLTFHERGAMSKPTLVVLAAGIGSRYGGLKQIAPVGPNGELIVDYSIYDALRAGFGKVVFVVNEQIEEAFRERVGQTIERQCETVYVRQRLTDVPPGFPVPANRRKPWGTAHATLVCREVVDTNLAVINADDFYGRASYEILCDYLRQARDDAAVADYCLVGFALLNTLSEHGHVARGVCTVDQDGFLIEIHERTRIRQWGEVAQYTEDGENWIEIPQDSIASLNTWGFTPGIFGELEARFSYFLRENAAHLETAEFFLPEVVGDIVRAGKARVRVLPTPERWFGVTYRQDLPKVQQAIQELIRQGVYPADLWRG